MSNIFINRNRSQGAYNVPIIKQRFLTTEELWAKRANDTKSKGDSFYKTSLKFGANPDLQEKHVGMQWSIVDTCDTIKPTQDLMEERWNQTQNSFPLYKASNIGEDPNQSYDQRLEQYPGPGSPSLHPSQQSNGFVNYQNSGGISRKDYLKEQINSIAAKIQRAKEIKGVLCLNNGNAYGASWRTPPLDLALQNKAGFKGGETAQRFYMKFPIYRPRAHEPPSVLDDVQRIWREQTSLSRVNSNQMASSMQSQDSQQLDKLLGPAETQFRYGRSHQRSNSLVQQTGSESKRALTLTQAENKEGGIRFSSKNTIQFPKRQRFNENQEEVIEEIKRKTFSTGNNLKTLSNKDQMSVLDGKSQMSKRTLTKSELSKYFKEQKERVDAEVKSRISQISKKSSFKEKFLRGIKSEENKTQPMEQVPEVVDEISYISDVDSEKKLNEEDKEREDAITVATSGIEALSYQQTDALQREYKLLMEQYDQELAQRQQLEQEIDKIKQQID